MRVHRLARRNEPSNYDWYLNGTSQQTGVFATAACARDVAGYTGETLWSQGEPFKDLGPSNDRVCFLTRVRGYFAGDGEQVRVRSIGGRWFLDGTSQQAGVRAGARCVYASSDQILSQEQWTHNGGDGHARRNINAFTVNGRGDFCALSHLQGSLDSRDDYVMVMGPKFCTPDTGCNWFAFVSGTTTGPLGLGAVCLMEKTIIG